MKLLASEIAAYFHKLPTPLQKMIQASSSNALKREMEDLEAGSIFRHLNITNFLEGDLFAWYVPVWSGLIEQLVRGMVARLDDYNPGTLSEEPASSRDLLKKLYQQLFPKSVRHDLGEYYTPDWLAEHVLSELEYIGDPDKRLLDPACGSGTFLVMAINRIRKWYDDNRERVRFDEGDLCRKILSNVIGFDLNPLAVMAARTNYLIAIRDLVGHVDKVEIPIYLCDSILTPSEYGGLFTTGLGKAKELKTAAAKFIIPTEIATDRDEVAKYAEQLEFCVAHGYSPKEFVERCRDGGFSIAEEALHSNLYEELVRLDKANKNGVWARIIKNAFAPLFVGTVDYVAGNPPWVRWGYLPREYRDATIHLWQEYGLFSLKGFEARLGAGEKDLSQLFVYACIDNYISKGGKLGFLITQTVFKAKGQAEGFRRFRLGPNGEPFRITRVDDFSKINPFEGASNLTVSFVAVKGLEQTYPVSYIVWIPKGGKVAIPADLRQAQEYLTPAFEEARPVDSNRPNSQWQTTSPETVMSLRNLTGQSDYQAKIGARTDPYGVFQLRILKRVTRDTVLVENCFDAGKRKIDKIQTTLESARLNPLIRGRDVDRWTIKPENYVLMVQDPEKRSPIPETTLKKELPKTYSYLLHFKQVLLQRGSRAVQSLMSSSEFYAMFAIGIETYAPYKVVWRRMGSDFRAAFCSTIEDEFLGDKLVIPSDTVSFVPFADEKEAYFFLGLINSTPARAAIYSFSPPGRGLGAPSMLRNLKIGKFDQADRTLRKTISDVSRKISKSMGASKPDFAALNAWTNELNSLAIVYWKIPAQELVLLEDLVSKRERPKKTKQLKTKSDLELLEHFSELAQG
jgi:N-6 DNA Methylase